ncbi:MAG TPA: guanylate kinase [Gemmatimonadaceae bacterium]|nr:guanylate kinase [Gemmatimonadaceae bacterium]
MIPFPIILSAPSGAGKTSIAHRLLALRSDVGYSVSCTTRPPRNGARPEVDGKDYHFLTTEQFLALRERGEFAESAQVHGNLYGTLRSEVERVLASGRHVVMDIDVQGAAQFRRAFPESVTIFILPPSADVLLERLLGRGTEDRAALAARMIGALEELRSVAEYQYVVVNDDIDRAVRQVSAIIDAETARHERLRDLDHDVRRLVQQLERELATSTGTNTGER